MRSSLQDFWDWLKSRLPGSSTGKDKPDPEAEMVTLRPEAVELERTDLPSLPKYPPGKVSNVFNMSATYEQHTTYTRWEGDELRTKQRQLANLGTNDC